MNCNSNILKIITIFFIVFQISGNAIAQIQKKSDFLSPLNIAPFLAGNFGELRSDHFHSGIDFKTQGSVGHKVFSVSDGYISRIKISPYGYGKSLYITHYNGLVSVYAHLLDFNPYIDSIVKSIQYSKCTFSFDTLFEENKHKVKAKSLVAYSGNTGGSAGPHLHFEIRDKITENTKNPLLYSFNINDHKAPVFYFLSVYPINKDTRINGKNEKLILHVIGSNGKYYLQNNQKIQIKGLAGFGIQVYDFLDGAPNKCGIYSLKLTIDTSKIFDLLVDEFAFAETRYINDLIDYEEFIKNKRYFYKTFTSPNNKLSLYKTLINRGIYNFEGKNSKSITISATDSYGNLSVLNFKVLIDTSAHKISKPIDNKYFMMMKFDKDNIISKPEISISVPAYSLFDSVAFNFSIDSISGLYSDIYNIHNKFCPLLSPFAISISTKKIPEKYITKAFIAKLGGGNPKYIGGEVVDTFITTTASSFGTYCIQIDTIPPVIGDNKPKIKDYSKFDAISFIIKDDISGIKNFNGFIDEKWVLFEYDPKTKTIMHKFDKKIINFASNHIIKVEVKDNCNNLTILEKKFFK